MSTSGTKGSNVLEVTNLSVHYPVRGRKTAGGKAYLRAVDSVTFDVQAGETYGLVGESGCGKSTTGRAIINLVKPTSGTVRVGGQDIARTTGAARKEALKQVQMIFQDPFSSLNPKKRVGDILAEALAIQGFPREGRREKVEQILGRVGFSAEHYGRFPHEFSGGQRQRIGLARALIVEPALIVCDEPVSALDVSVQAQVLNLLQEVQEETGVAYVFISHDLGVVRHISDRVGVMYLGEIVEEGLTHELFENPQHPYTRALLSAMPSIGPGETREKVILGGEVPSPLNKPSGCAFRTRCPFALPICAQEKPRMTTASPGHYVSCHLTGKAGAAG